MKTTLTKTKLFNETNINAILQHSAHIDEIQRALVNLHLYTKLDKNTFAAIMSDPANAVKTAREIINSAR